MNLIGISIVFVAAILFWSYKKKEYEKEKSKNSKPQNYSGSVFAWKSGGIFLAIVLGVNVFIGLSAGSGEGKVNLFPVEASAKNYRLDAWFVEQINYVPMFVHNSFAVTHVYWGEDGEQEIEVSDCVLKQGELQQCDIGGNTYVVEIAEIECLANSPDDC